MESERIDTTVAWNTEGVDKGLARVETALARMDKAETKTAAAAAAREAQTIQRQRQNKERALRDLERMEKDSADRRMRMTEAAYKSFDKSAQLRETAMVNSLRRSESAFSRANSGAMRAGSGGHGFGSMGGGNNTRMAGDALNMLTGGSGNVMRLQALSHFGPLLGGGAAIAAMFAKGYSANSRMVQDTQGLRRSTGERTYSDWADNGIAAPIMRMLPGWMQSGGQIQRAATRSQEGMSAQREEITGSVEKLQGDRSYWSTFGSQFGKDFSGHGRMEEGFEAEEAAQNKLLELDGKIAGRIKEQTAARRMGVFESEHEGQLAANRLEMEEKIAALDDKFGAGKISVGERMAGIKDAQSGRNIADFETNQSGRAERRAVSAQNDETYIKGRGERVAQRSAESAYNYANAKFEAAPNTEAKDKAMVERNARFQDVVEERRATRGREASLDIAKETADFRGGAEARSLHASEQNLRNEEQLLEIAKEAGTDAERAAQVRVSQAKLVVDLTKQEIAARRIDNAAAIGRGSIQERKARFGLEQNTFSENAQTRFEAGQNVESESAKSAVKTAENELQAAQSKVANERALQNGRASEEAIKAQTLAQQGLNAAKIAQLDVDKKLKFEWLERERQKTAQLDAAKAETAAMRIDNTGRTDRAEVFRGRAQSAAQALEYQRQGRPDMAAEVQEQQRQREVGAFDEKFLDANGHRRRRSDLNREERAARKIEQRRGRANSRLEQDVGLVNVHRDINGRVIGGMDPLTREKVSADELYSRKHKPANTAEAEKAAENKALQDILQELKTRLPKASQ